MALTVPIGSLAGFALGRMRLRRGWLISNAALLIYAVPAYFLVIPYYRLMHSYGLMDNLWAVIAAKVTFTTPYAIIILQWYGRLIPLELDEAARIDGATPLQVYLRIYLPLMAPALVAVGTYALLVAWNEYLYQFLLLNSRATRRWRSRSTSSSRARLAVELHDGDCHHLRVAAGGDLLCAAPLYGGRTDSGCRQGMTIRQY